MRESQAFVHEAATMARFHRLNGDYLETRVKAQKLVATYFPFIQFLSGIDDVIVLGVGAGLVTTGHLSSGALIAFVLYIDMFFAHPSLSQVFDSWQQTRVSVNRISDLMQLETRTPEPESPQEIGRLHGDIVLADVRFSYPTVENVRAGSQEASTRACGSAAPNSPDAEMRRPPEALRGIDLRIVPGETVALVGETGAGKSTVMKLLARFYDPDEGSVRIDGHDLRTSTCARFVVSSATCRKRRSSFRDPCATTSPTADLTSTTRGGAGGARRRAHTSSSPNSRGLPPRLERTWPLALVGPAPAHRARSGRARRSGDLAVG